jgi:hypothetical protein
MEEKIRVLDDTLKVRVNEVALAFFKDKSSKAGKPYQLMVREIVTAYNEDRLKIIPTKDQAAGLKIYRGE